MLLAEKALRVYLVDVLGAYTYAGNDPTDQIDPTGMDGYAANGGFTTDCGTTDICHSYGGVAGSQGNGGPNKAGNPTALYSSNPLGSLANDIGAAADVVGSAAEVSAGAVAGLATAFLIASTTPTVDREGDEVPQNLIRGGQSKPPDLQSKAVVGYMPLTGVSATSAPQLTVDQLAAIARYPNAAISVTTVQRLEDQGFKIARTPLPGQPLHVTIVAPMPIPEDFAKALSNSFLVRPNPSRGN
jgi:hypothetical protein